MENTIDVYHDRRTEQPHVEDGHEALSAGQHLRLVPVLGQQSHSFVDRLRPLVPERNRLHGRSSQTRGAVSGNSTSSRSSASAIAFAIAAGTLIVFPSPTPFAPSG